MGDTSKHSDHAVKGEKMDEETTTGITVTLEVSELRSLIACLCVQCQREFQDHLQQMFERHDRDRLERARKACADQQEAELKRREFLLNGD